MAQQSGNMSGGGMSNGGKMSGGKMSGGAMSSPAMGSASMRMSKSNMKIMKMCQGMDHDAMMNNSKCKKFMAKHSDMMNNNGMNSGSSPQ